ncbi:MAG: PEP-CTERM sorting domain-containing protein [Crocosphaera sp.]
MITKIAILLGTFSLVNTFTTLPVLSFSVSNDTGNENVNDFHITFVSSPLFDLTSTPWGKGELNENQVTFDFAGDALGNKDLTFPGYKLVLDPDGDSKTTVIDAWWTVNGERIGTVNFTGSDGTILEYGTFSVKPVPEPLTILGAGTALGFGTLFKRKLNASKKGKEKIS